MFVSTRELIAYGIIAATLMVLAPLAFHHLQRRKREKLRRQGIKRHGH